MIRAPDQNPAGSYIRGGVEPGRMDFNKNQERRFQNRSREDTWQGRGSFFMGSSRETTK